MAVSERARAQNRLRWELLSGIIRKDLQVKYQGSILGFLWSLANPLVVLVVYSFVFGVVLRSGIPHFGYYLLSALLVWNFFAGSVSTACGCVIGNAGLVQKVPFPLTVLPLAAVGFNFIHLVLQLGTMMLVMAATGYTAMIGPGLFLIFPAIAVAALLAIGVSFLVAALNVRYKDTAHIVEILLLAGFWVNPIVYALYQVYEKLGHWAFLYWINPMASVSVTMQRAIYAGNATITITGKDGQPKIVPVLASERWLWYFEHLGLAALISAVIFAIGYTVYRRMSADFAENI